MEFDKFCNPPYCFSYITWTKNNEGNMNSNTSKKIWWWSENAIWTILAKGNPINVGHNHEVRSNHCTLFLDNLCLLKDSQNKPLLLKFWRTLLSSSSMSMVWFFPHRVILNMQNTYDSNPWDNNNFQLWVDLMSLNIIHTPKWKQIG